MNDRGVSCLKSLDRLEVLNISHCPLLTDVGIVEMLCGDDHESSRVSRLTNLNLSHCANIGEESIYAIRDTIALTLRHLDLRSIRSDISRQTLRTLIAHSHELRSFRISKVSGMDSNVVNSMAVRLHHLTFLECSDCDSVHDTTLSGLRSMMTLTTIVLSGCKQLTIKGLRRLPPFLVHLELVNLPYIDDDACSTLHTSFPYLESINLSQSPKITSIGVQALLSQRLQCINVYNCPHIGPTELQKIMENLNLLLHVDDKRNLCGLFAKAPVFHSQNPNDFMEKSSYREKLRNQHHFSETSKQRCRNVVFSQCQAETNAATLLQYRYRKTFREQMAYLAQLELELNQDIGATHLQRLWKGYSTRRMYIDMKKEYTASALFLQCKWKKHQVIMKRKRAAKHWQHRSVSITLSAWKMYVVKTLQERSEAMMASSSLKALQFMSGKIVSATFFSWKEFTRTTGRQRRKALTHWKNRALTPLWVDWNSFVQNEIQSRKQLVTVFLNVVTLDSHNSTRQQLLLKTCHVYIRRKFIQAWFQGVKETKAFIIKAVASLLCNVRNTMNYSKPIRTS